MAPVFLQLYLLISLANAIEPEDRFTPGTLPYPARTPEQIQPTPPKPTTPPKYTPPDFKTTQYTNYKLPEARVVMMNEALIKKDFPQTRSMSSQQIRNWLLNQAAYMSKDQIDPPPLLPEHEKFISKQGINLKAPVHENISVDRDNTKNSLRPKDYGRGHVLEVRDTETKEILYIDVKGSGVTGTRPFRGSHSDGHMTLGEAISEYKKAEIIQQNLAETPLSIGNTSKIKGIVGNYAVLDLGPNANVLFKGGGKAPAGMILRQAHQRMDPTKITETEKIFAEKYFREMGLTLELPNSGINLQLATTTNRKGIKSYYVVDFGHITGVQENKVLKQAVNVDQNNWEHSVLKEHPKYKLSFAAFSDKPGSEPIDSAHDNLRKWSEDAAWDIQKKHQELANAGYSTKAEENFAEEMIKWDRIHSKNIAGLVQLREPSPPCSRALQTVLRFLKP